MILCLNGNGIDNNSMFTRKSKNSLKFLYVCVLGHKFLESDKDLSKNKSSGYYKNRNYS